MKATKQEKKLIQASEDFTMETGIVMEHHSFDIVSSREKLLVCLIRGLLIFLSVFGVTGLFITSFELPCNQLIIYISEFFLSLIIAFLYYNKWLFNIGYVLVLILFIFFAIAFRDLANSGFNSIINIILNVIDDKMNLGGVRQYTEAFSNRQLTITVCLLLVSFFAICYFNSTISGYMSPTFLFLQMFPIAQICLYLCDDVNYFYVICCVGAWLSVCIIKHSNRFRINLKKQILFYTNKHNVFEYEEKSFHASIRGLFISCSMIALIFVGITFGLSRLTPYKIRDNQSSWKKGTDAFVEEFALNGLMGFFNQYEATGGMSGGQLGGVRSVTMDFETDLELEFVPYNTQTLYLKGYVGEVYSARQWSRLDNYDDLMNSPYYLTDYELLVNKESNKLSNLFKNGGSYTAKAYMKIKNVAANQNYFYMPYYTNIDINDLSYFVGVINLYRGDVVDSAMPTGTTKILEYYPLLMSANDAAEATEDDIYEYYYRSFAYDNYLQIPVGIRSELRSICKEQDFYNATSLEEAVSRIQDYFYNEFTYSLNPGKTPDNKDFATYFLTQQKNGYCAHFATAGCLLLRTLGYPARYVEGYAVDVGAQEDATVVSTDVTDWYEGYNELGSIDELSVLNLEVTDASAHAWVEVYVEGLGWVPVEFTVAQAADYVSATDFWSRFRDFFGGNSEGESPLQTISETIQASKPVLATSGIVILGIIIFIIYVRRIVRMYRLYYQKKNKRLVCQYQALVKMLRTHGYYEKGNIYHEDAKMLLKSKLGLDSGVCDLYIGYIVTASFGKEQLPKDEMDWSTEIFKNILRVIRKDIKWYRKVLLLIQY